MKSFRQAVFMTLVIWMGITAGCNHKEKAIPPAVQTGEQPSSSPASKKYELEPRLYLNEESGMIEYGIRLKEDKKELAKDTVSQEEQKSDIR